MIRPATETSEWVLKNFSKAEEPALADFIDRACQAAQAFVFLGVERAANQFNQKGS